VQGLGQRHAEQPGQADQQHRLAQQQADHQEHHRAAVGQGEGHIDRHAHRHEEEPQQEAAKGLDLGGDLMAVGGLGQQHPGQKGAEGHGHAGELGDQPGGDHHKEGQRGEDLGLPSHRDLAKEMAQDDPAQSKDRHHRDHHLERCQAERHADRQVVLAERQDNDQKEPDQEVLHQEHGEGGTAELGGQLAPVHQKPQDDRGRGQRQGAAHDHGRGGRRYAGQQGNHRDDHGGDQDLPEAEREDPPAHELDAFERQLQADGEEQEDDPELGQGPRGLHLPNEAQAGGPDHAAGHQIAQDRAQLQALEQGHRHDGRQEYDHDLE
jgi:hypothetical protein